MTADLRSAFIDAIQNVVDNAIIEEIIKKILNGDVEGAIQALGFSPAALRPLTVAIERAYEQGGVWTGQGFPKYLNTSNGKAIFRFDVGNPRAEKYLKDNSSSLIVRLTEDTRTNVRNILQRGVAEGRNPRNIALDIIGRIDRTTGRRVGGIVGLTPNQEYWVTNTRRELQTLNDNYFNRELRDKRFDRTVSAAIRSGKPLTANTIEKLVGRYKDNALQFRGENIARTEALQSLNASEYEAIKQAVDMGSVRPQDITREWDSAGDSRVRFLHKKMDGQRVGIDEPFVSPSGARLMHPGDISLGAKGEEIIGCRCRVKTVIDWLADID